MISYSLKPAPMCDTCPMRGHPPLQKHYLLAIPLLHSFSLFFFLSSLFVTATGEAVNTMASTTNHHNWELRATATAAAWMLPCPMSHPAAANPAMLVAAIDTS